MAARKTTATIQWKKKRDPWRPRDYWFAADGSTSLLVTRDHDDVPARYQWGVLPAEKKEITGDAPTLKEAKQRALETSRRKGNPSGPSNNPVTVARLRHVVDQLNDSAAMRFNLAAAHRGKKRQTELAGAYAKAETARFIAVELARYGAGEDTAFAIQEQIWTAMGGSKKNPMPGVPGGGISECIAEMSTRPDVDDAGALCAWIAQQRGEYGWRSLPRIKRGGKKTSKGLRSLMRKALT